MNYWESMFGLDKSMEVQRQTQLTEWLATGLAHEFPYLDGTSAIARIGIILKKERDWSDDMDGDGFSFSGSDEFNSPGLADDRFDVFDFIAKTLKYHIDRARMNPRDEESYTALVTRVCNESVDYQNMQMSVSATNQPVLDNLRQELGIFFRLEADRHFQPKATA